MIQQAEPDTYLQNLLGNGEVARLLARYDWAKSPLGPPSGWPVSFRVTLSNIVASPFPMVLLWGPELSVFYNDAYIPSVSSEDRHPRILGSSGPEAYGEGWTVVSELIRRVMDAGETIYYEDLPTPALRNGRMEEVYWTSGLSPVRDDDGAIGGVLVVCKETTGKVARFRNLMHQSSSIIAVLLGEELRVAEANPAALDMWQVGSEIIGEPLFDVLPEMREQGFPALMENVLRTGIPYRGTEVAARFERLGGDSETRYFNIEYTPFYEQGLIAGVMVLATDVTGQVLARQERAIAEDEVRSAIAAADLGYWNVDPRSNTLKCNRRTRELFGLPVDVEDVDLSLAIKAMHDQDRDRVVGAITRTVTDPAHSDYDIEYRVVHPEDGITRHVRAIGKSYFEEGVAYRFSGTIQDITRKKLAEESLRASEQRFVAAVAAVQGVLWTNTAEGRMEGEQPGWSALTGQTREEYEGFGWANAVHPDDAQASVDAWNEAVAEKKKYVFEHRLRRADGSWGRFSIQAIPVFKDDGSIREWVGVHTDITEQRTAEEALRNSEAQLRQLADFMPQMVWATNAAGYHDFYNQRWYEFTGMNYEQTKGEGWSHLLHPDDMDRTQAVWQHCLETGAYYEIEYRMRRADGAYRWLLARATPVQDEEGKIRRWFGTCTDIHDQKAFATTLERLVAERTVELQRSNDDLQQFAHVASHDLKEPVRKIATFESRLSHEFGKDLPERAQAYLEKIRTASRRMYTMIEGVLRYSSISEGDQATEPVNLNEVVAQILSDLEVLIAEKEAMIEAGPLPVLPGSPTLLYQLFYNIINNALKFAAPGRALRVSISAAAQEGHARISVADNGIGFSPDNAERIFKTFTRLHPKDKYEGTGLGLALCQKIVSRHGGTIRAEGREGEGATFIITLPL
ncbi:MAG: PAS domain S-box protein [Chitinophagaceae bacterium]|nr:MAG: PAS domain S-box protein [Chitinophagaceae bacterium]